MLPPVPIPTLWNAPSAGGVWSAPALLAAGAALLLCITLLALRLRTRFLARRNRILKALVAERTRDLAAANAALRKANLALREQSRTDPMTGLRNRRYLADRAPQDLAAVARLYRDRPPVPGDRSDLNRDLAFLMVDLDFFKAVNDTHGHAAGDAVLLQVADILRSATRNIDTLVRWGGEEFLVLARNAYPGELPVIAERIRAQIEAHGFWVELAAPVHLTCSVGFASFPLRPELLEQHGWEQVVALADACLYQAKTAGRNRWVGLVPPEAPASGAPEAMGRMSAPELVARGLVRRVEGPATGRG